MSAAPPDSQRRRRCERHPPDPTPPGVSSCAPRRTNTGMAPSSRRRTSASTSRGRRSRFSRLPPYWSVALVGERRQELRQQEAVGRVHLDRVEACAPGPGGRVAERRGRLVDLGRRQRLRHLAVGLVRMADGRRRDRTPPRHCGVRPRPGVGELHAGDRPLCLDRGGQSGEARHQRVIVDAHLGWCVTSPRVHVRVLDNDQAAAGSGSNTVVLDERVADRAVGPARPDHIGGMTIRFRRVRPAKVNGERSPGISGVLYEGGAGIARPHTSGE